MNQSLPLRVSRPAAALDVAVALVSGCAVVRPTDPYAPVAAHLPATRFAPPLTTAATTAERSGFRQPLTLADCLALAAQNNPALTAAGQDARAAAARWRAAKAGQLPTFRADGGHTRNLHPQRPI